MEARKMKYAIIKFKGELGWARVLKQNKNGSIRVKLFKNWNETIRKEDIFDIVAASVVEERLAVIKGQQ